MNKFLFFFLFLTFSLSAQIRGVVKDSISGEPISYVNIWVENETIGTTSETNGSFSLDLKEEKVLVFSALGYEIKKTSSKSEVILLKPKVVELKEVVIEQPKFKKEIDVGDFTGIELNTGVSNTGQENIHIWGKVFESNDKIKNYPFIKSIEFMTKSKVKNAKIRLRFYKYSHKETKYEDVVDEDVIIEVKKGNSNNLVDLTQYKIKVPNEGIVVGFEFLKLRENKYDYKYTIRGEKGRHKGLRYEPTIMGFMINDLSSLVLLNYEGKLQNCPSSIELAVKLTLTN
jgi:hypothetical protein